MPFPASAIFALAHAAWFVRAATACHLAVPGHVPTLCPLLDNVPCLLFTAHSEQDFVTIAKAFKESVLELQEAEFLPRHRNVEALAIDDSRPWPARV